MKTRYAVMIALAVVLAMASGSPLIAGQSGGRSGGIPVPTGQFSVVTQGSLAFCLNPNTFALEACTTSGALVYPVTDLGTGSETRDSSGKVCATETSVFSALPQGLAPPILSPGTVVDKSPGTVVDKSPGTVVDKLTKYNPTTGIGEESFTGYSGGSCSGVNFDSSGATKVSSGTYQFVVSKHETRIDAVITALTNPGNSIGTISLMDTLRKQ